MTSGLCRAGSIGDPGALAGSLLPGDVYARFLRARGEEVLFVCVDEEHELTTVDGIGVAEHCERLHSAELEVGRHLGLSFDAFGRSSDRRNHDQTEYFVRRLEEEGYIEARSVRELGDRRHLFLLRSKLVAELRSWLEARPGSAAAAAPWLEALDAGIDDVRVTREASWGIPVVRSGFEDMTYSVSFGAPIAYVGATREWAEECDDPDAWRRWWCGSEDVTYVQFVGRDDVECHTLTFPAAMIGSREAWKLPDLIKASNGFAHGGGMLQADAGGELRLAEAGVASAADCWRYYLLAEGPEDEDASFSWERFAAVVNDDLVDGFGRLVERAVGLAVGGGGAPQVGGRGHEGVAPAERLEAGIGVLTERLAGLEFRRSVAELRALWVCGTACVERASPAEALDFLAVLARVSAPVIPFAAQRVLDLLGVPRERRGWPPRIEAAGASAVTVELAEQPIFRRIESREVDRWRARPTVPVVT